MSALGIHAMFEHCPKPGLWIHCLKGKWYVEFDDTLSNQWNTSSLFLRGVSGGTDMHCRNDFARSVYHYLYTHFNSSLRFCDHSR